MIAPLSRSPVLVTGATGFIGREVVRCLLGSDRPVVALARARAGQSAGARVAAAVRIEPDGDRLDVVEADLTEPGCGLSPSKRRYLRDRVETAIHCAGETSFFPQEMSRFRAGHIQGPLDLLHSLGRGRLQRWAHLSTAYVCGRRSGRIFEREGDVGQSFHNPYEQVKLESEEATREAGARLGVGVCVIRPSVVVGPSPETAGSHPANLFLAFIRLVAMLAERSNGHAVPLRILAAPHAPFNIVPVDYVAEAIAALAGHPDGVGQTFHLVVSEPPSQEDILAMIGERVGLRGLSVVKSNDAALPNASLTERKLTRMLAGYREYLEQNVRFDDAHARGLLNRCGVPGPTLSRKAVHQLIDRALGTLPAPECVRTRCFAMDGGEPKVVHEMANV